MRFMYRVILVDDEPLALEGLKLAVDWGALGYEICAGCSNGETAARLIDELQPDLVITDIMMPGMDGLQLIEQVIHQSDADIKFIIVSSYGEFEYAQTALRFGIQHYVLKPVFAEELTEVLLEMGRRLDEGRNGNGDNSGPSQDSLVRKEILQQILLDEIKPEDRSLVEKSFHKREIWQPWVYLLVETGFIPELPPHNGEAAGEGIEAELLRCVAGTRQGDSCLLAEQDPDCYGLLIGADLWAEEGLGTMVRRLCRELPAHGIDGFYIAVGEAAPDLFAIGHSRQTACQARIFQFYTPVNRSVWYSEIKDRKITRPSGAIAFLEAAVDALKQINPESLENVIGSAFAHFQTVLPKPEDVQMFVMNLVYRSSNLIREMNGNSTELFVKTGIGNFEHQKLTLADYQRWLQSYATECCRYLHGLRERNSRANIYRIEEYLQQNFRQDLTLKAIAAKFYMHPAYIGQLFQKRFGCSFHEYLHRLRIREAENLMAATALKSHEIATAIGYNNYHSFLDNFKKYTGCTPADYKNRRELT
jgi:two-component system response regulator YesN